MKFEFNWSRGFWGNYVLMCWWDSNMSDLGWKVKGQPWPLKLIYSHCLIRLNISNENNGFCFNNIQTSGFWGNYILMCWWDSNMSHLGWKVKGQPWPLKLIYSHCLIWFNILSENNDFGLNSFQKMNFTKKSHLNALGSKFDHDRK